MFQIWIDPNIGHQYKNGHYKTDEIDTIIKKSQISINEYDKENDWTKCDGNGIIFQINTAYTDHKDQYGNDGE